MDIPKGKLCDSGCGKPAKFFSKGTGRFRCLKSASSCPENRKKNSIGIKKAHSEGRMYKFSNDDRSNSQARYRRRLVEEKPFEELGAKLRKKIVLEDQEYSCLHCGLDDWQGMRITLEIDHIDGDTSNNCRNNLRGLCPNCHSLTDTWKVGTIKGKKLRKRTDEEIIDAFKSTESYNEMLKKLDYKWGSILTVKKVLFRHRLIDKM